MYPLRKSADIEVAAGAGQRLEVEPCLAGPGRALDVQIERITEAPGGRKIRARLQGHAGNRRRERIDLQKPAATAGRPRPEPAEIPQVTDTPAFLRPGRVELSRPAPRPARRKGQAGGATITLVSPAADMSRWYPGGIPAGRVPRTGVTLPSSSWRSPFTPSATREPARTTRTGASGGPGWEPSAPMAARRARRVPIDISRQSPRTLT